MNGYRLSVRETVRERSILPFLYALAAYKAHLIEPWFVFWEDIIKPKYTLTWPGDHDIVAIGTQLLISYLQIWVWSIL